MSEKKYSRAAIFSDQAIFLRGLTALITSHQNFRLVGEAHSGAEIIQLCHLSEPDILLFDLHNAWEHAQEIIQQIHQRWPSMKLVLLVGHFYENRAKEEFQRLPVYYISRDVTEEEFKDALTKSIKIHTRLAGKNALRIPVSGIWLRMMMKMTGLK
jgi:DNA-binding NarL/FixJ family response regulator